ncbi:hypothetical protein VNO78_19070 [Psophocarpus tetragonolobus]|uniref:Transmembrane protein n=1 Tax=Psophocarpus tetragonolobus TaxID=3891 RepID=A0AAN9XG43_PSOTE
MYHFSILYWDIYLVLHFVIYFIFWLTCLHLLISQHCNGQNIMVRAMVRAVVKLEIGKCKLVVREYGHKMKMGIVNKGGEELGIESLVFMLCFILSLLAAIIFFCADGVPKKASQDNNCGNAACTAGCGV